MNSRVLYICLMLRGFTYEAANADERVVQADPSPMRDSRAASRLFKTMSAETNVRLSSCQKAEYELVIRCIKVSVA